MKLRFSKTFTKDYTRLPADIQKKTDRRLRELAQDLRHPGVKARKMAGVGDVWEGRIDGHYRFTFRIEGDRVVVRRAGTHEIYKKP